jgi:hypothetical protein
MTIPDDLSQNNYMRPLLLLSIIVLGAAVAYPQIPRAGTVHSSVPVAAQPSNSYALYPPPGYSTEALATSTDIFNMNCSADPDHNRALLLAVKVQLSQICVDMNNVVAATEGVPYEVLAERNPQYENCGPTGAAAG